MDPKYNFLRQVHSNPKKVEIHDLETYKVDHYPSIYKAVLALEQNPRVISMYNLKVWSKRYAIKVLTESINLNFFIPNWCILGLFLVNFRHFVSI